MNPEYKEQNSVEKITKQSLIRLKCEKADLYDRVAEEATELAHAAIKYARAIREGWPEYIDPVKVKNDIDEEFTDVIVTSEVLGLHFDSDLAEAKLNRWICRLKENGVRFDD